MDENLDRRGILFGKKWSRVADSEQKCVNKRKRSEQRSCKETYGGWMSSRTYEGTDRGQERGSREWREGEADGYRCQE